MAESSEKHIKDLQNETIQNVESTTEPSPDDAVIDPLEKIKLFVEKTESMKEIAKEKNEQLEQQFKELKEKLSSSSEYLMRIKKNIENLKFSYQKNVSEMQKHLDPADCLENRTPETKHDIGKEMEEIRRKIETLQARVKEQTDKHQHVTEDYKSAFDKVVDTLEVIESGSFSSQDLRNKSK
ncbi:unnamed protein product [Acanthoscelides obtectus]|uniref:Uncharacterized protein n=1 Tax=Acanthoscelides obtectus TaxID=200917 RepID=A0A9P0Q076_ACAOB|nr:unnamed protein product [Acanthoscelides obtectus]CAK1650388.1 hypothetical protein AOBTE_LOCUS16757 [Acanthoscelides obtectus]